MDDSVLRISLCGLSPDCEDLGFFQDVARPPALSMFDKTDN